MTFSLSMIVKLVLSVVLLASFFGCDKFLMGKPKKPDLIEVQKDNLKCLKELSSKVKAYLNSEASAIEIDDTFTCLDTTLNEFAARAQGTRDANVFSAEDIFQIFQTFYAEANLSQEATNDLLKLKSGLLGGDPRSFTKIEIAQLRTLLKVVQPELHLLRPYAKLLAFEKLNKVHSKETIDAGFLQVNESLKKLLAATRLTKSDYNFEDFKKLIQNLAVMGQNSTDLLALATDVKNLLTGVDSLSTEADFNSAIESLVEVLRLQSIHVEGHVLFELKDGNSMADTLGYIESWIKVVENSLQFKTTNIIKKDTIDPLIKKLVSLKIVSDKFTAATLSQFYKLILVRVFEKGPAGDVSKFLGLQPIHLVNLRRELAAFTMYSEFLRQIKFPAVVDATGSARLEINYVQNRLKSHKFVSSTVASQHVVDYVNELKSEFLIERPVVYRFDKMIIAVNQEIWQQNWRDLMNGVIVKFLARELLIGWGNGIDTRLVKNATLSEANLVQWYEEFKPFGIEIKAFDPRSVNTGARSFKEANLFSYAADGNDQMNFLETVVYLNILSSGGGQSFPEIKAGFTKANCNLNEVDAFGNPWNDEECAFQDLKANYKYYFNNLSYLVGFLGRLDDAQFKEFYNQAMEVARLKPEFKGKLETADIRTFTILLHYIEAIYAKYDTDRNWTFSAPEIRSAYPSFKNFATEFAQQTSADQISLFNFPLVQLAGYYCYTQEDLIQESFIFLVYNGVTPGITDLNIAPCFGKRALIDFRGEVDRKTIINTFKIFKAVLGS